MSARAHFFYTLIYTSFPASYVFLIRNGFEMVWVNANPIAAKMIDHEPCGNISFMESIGKSVGDSRHRIERN